MKIDAEIHFEIGGVYEVRPMQVTEWADDGSPKKWQPAGPWKRTKNLVLPAGRNYGKNWHNHVRNALGNGVYCHAGTGSTPNQVTLDGTYQQAGTTITRATGTGVFTSANVNDFVKFGTGERAKIVSFTNSTTVVVDRSQTVAAASLTVYDTSRVNLDTWVQSTTTVDVAGGASGYTENFDTGASTRWETYNFTAEASARTYTEVGIGNGSTSSTQLISRVVLDSPVNVGIGQFLQVKFTLQMLVGNFRTSEPFTVSITGWPRPYTIQSITPGAAGGTAFDILLSEACSSHYAVGRPIVVTGALPVQYAVTSYASTGSDFTVTTGTAHGRNPGDSIVIAGATPSAYNGTWTVATVPTSTTLTVTSAINPGAGSGGTVRQATPATWYDGTWTIASFPTSSTIRVTNNTISVAAGATGTVKNNVTASGIISGKAFNVTDHFGSSTIGYRGALDACSGSGATLSVGLIAEANLRTGMQFGVTTTVPTTVVSKSLTATADSANRSVSYTATVLSGEAISQTIRQIAFSTNYGVFWVTFNDRQRKDDGYQLTLNFSESWEPELN